MATFLCYGNFNGRYGDQLSYDILYDILQQNVEGNYSVVRFYGYLRSFGPSGSGTPASCYINDVLIGTFSSVASNSYTQIGYRDITVNHDSAGKASIYVTGFCDTAWTLGDASCSGTLTLPDIPRASKPTASNGNIGENITIYTNRKSSSFTHTLTYVFGSLSGTIATKTNQANVSWTLPTSFYAQIPNSSSGTGTIYCNTYNGNTQVGNTQSCTFIAVVKESTNKPTATISVVDTNKTLDTGVSVQTLTGDSTNKTFIRYLSNAEVSLSSTALNSAKIVSSNIT